MLDVVNNQLLNGEFETLKHYQIARKYAILCDLTAQIRKVQLINFEQHDCVFKLLDPDTTESYDGLAVLDDSCKTVIVSDGVHTFAYNWTRHSINKDGHITVFAPIRTKTGACDTDEQTYGRDARNFIHWYSPDLSNNEDKRLNTTDSSCQLRDYQLCLFMWTDVANEMREHIMDKTSHLYGINHKSNDRRDNSADNLELYFDKENLIHARMLYIIADTYPELSYKYNVYNNGHFRSITALTFPLSVKEAEVLNKNVKSMLSQFIGTIIKTTI